MLPDTDIIDEKYKLFVEKVAATKLVWGLMNKQGWANSSAKDDEETTVIPFWSDRALAKACARDDWKGFTANEIPLAEFLESWCIDMDEADTLAGINWDAHMNGHETEALQVVFDVLNRLKAIQSGIKFRNYDSIDEFIAEIKAE